MKLEMKTERAMLVAAIVVLALASAPQSAWAYAGPGSGLTVIGAALAFVGGVFLAIVGFIWYPIKRLWRAVTGKRQKAPDPSVDAASR